MSDDRQDNEPGEVSLRALERRTGGLPRDIMPQRDLWPGIEARLRPANTAERALLHPWRRTVLPALSRLAAAVLLVVGSSLTTLWLAEDRFVRQVDAGSVLPAAADGYPLAPGYLRARDELMLGLEPTLTRLSPDTRLVVERNLREIERGLEEIITALTRDPGNDSLQRLLLAGYQEELRYLNDIHLLSEMTPGRSET